MFECYLLFEGSLAFLVSFAYFRNESLKTLVSYILDFCFEIIRNFGIGPIIVENRKYIPFDWNSPKYVTEEDRRRSIGNL